MLYCTSAGWKKLRSFTSVLFVHLSWAVVDTALVYFVKTFSGSRSSVYFDGRCLTSSRHRLLPPATFPKGLCSGVTLCYLAQDTDFSSRACSLDKRRGTASVQADCRTDNMPLSQSITVEWWNMMQHYERFSLIYHQCEGPTKKEGLLLWENSYMGNSLSPSVDSSSSNQITFVSIQWGSWWKLI